MSDDGHGPQQAPGATPPAPGPVPPPPPRDPDGDGVSLAAFITGLLSLGPVPLVLGIVGYERSRRRGARAPWMAVTGIVLGAVSSVGLLLLVPLIAFSLLVVGHVASVDDGYRSGGSWSLTWEDPRGHRTRDGDRSP